MAIILKKNDVTFWYVGEELLDENIVSSYLIGAQTLDFPFGEFVEIGTKMFGTTYELIEDEESQFP